MKTRYIILSLTAALFLTSCVAESDHYLDSLKLSSSFVTIPVEGGDKTITIDAQTDWTFDFDIEVDTTYVDPVKGSKKEKITRNQLTQFYDIDSLDNDGKEVITHWLTIAPASGKKGRTEVKFTSLARPGAKQVTVYLKSGDQIQNIVVSLVESGKQDVPVSTVEKITEGPDGKTYRAKGYCTSIKSTAYGNWYLADGTVDGTKVKDLYIYGTVDDAGSYNWSSFGIGVGDLVTVEGPKSTYNGTVELVDARVIEVQKALLLADQTEYTLTKSDTLAFGVKMKQNGETFIFESRADWLHVDKNYDLTKGVLTLNVSATENNTGANRTGKIWCQSTLLGKDKKGNPKRDTTEVTLSFTQVAETVEGTLLNVRELVETSTSSKNPKFFDFTLNETVTVTYVSGSNFFLESPSCGLLVYSDGVSLSAGQTITGRIFGSGYAYNSLPEVTALDLSLAEVSAAPKLSKDLPQPTKVTLADLADKWDDYFCRYITVEDVAVTDTVAARFEYVEMNEDGTPKTKKDKNGVWQYAKASGDRGGKIADDVENKTNEIAVNVTCKKFLNMDADKRYDVTGACAVYNSTHQINIYDPSQVKELKKKEE